jgi:hypothetical protein
MSRLERSAIHKDPKLKIINWIKMMNPALDKLNMIIWIDMIKGSLGGETSVLRTFRMSGKELAKKEFVRERVSQRKS